MKLLLTNDDGIEAPGLQALLEAAVKVGKPIVIAPARALSGCSHRVTTDQPIRVEQRHSAHYAVEGTPADCVRVALHEIATDIDCVLSGINAGGNLGADVHHSGTVAAVREAVLHGRRGIAVSQYSKKGLPIDWQRAARWIVPILQDLLGRPWTGGTFWNINLPHLEATHLDPDVVFCKLDPAPLPVSFRRDGELFHYDANYHGRQRETGTDVDVCFRGMIAVTSIMACGPNASMSF
jgi:5'-nucleotidase